MPVLPAFFSSLLAEELQNITSVGLVGGAGISRSHFY